jgi:putative hemolysin
VRILQVMTTALFQAVIPNLLPLRLPRALENLVSRALGIQEIARVYDALRSMGDERPIADRLLDFLGVTFTTSDIDLARIPNTGPAIVTANHPFGILEGAILASLLGRIRPDVRFLANGILNAIPEVRDLLIPVDPIHGRSAIAGNGRGLRAALEHLRSGGMLVIFPAGEVSHFRWSNRTVSDGEWNTSVARMVGIADVPVVPLYVEGTNSLMFQLAGLAHSAFRTALLCRELLNKSGRSVEVRAGAAIQPDKLKAMPTAREQTDYLRWRTYLLASREPFKPRTALPLSRKTETHREPIAPALPANDVAKEVARLTGERMLSRSGDLEAYLAPAIEIPKVLHELGRLRELTFRAAGEGTGNALDLDEFDDHYLHLFVWNARKLEVVGAYRLARTDVVRRSLGVRGLYTATLFRYSDPFLDRVGPALELGRSFVRQEYQRGFAPLLLLWKGIGAFIARNPQYKTLFGPVSISNEYQAVSRELMVSFLEKYAMLREWTSLVRNRHASAARRLTGAHRPAYPNSGLDVEDLAAMVGDIEQKPVGIPVLLRQYLRLGGKLLGFNVDPQFANALDGLILVDLTKTEPKLLDRYLGAREAAAFLDFQRGQHATH